MGSVAEIESIMVVDGDTEGQIVSALTGRADMYRLLSGLYLRPLTQQQIDELCGADFAKWQGLNETFDAGLNDVIRYLAKSNSGTREELAVDYTSAFGGTKTVDGKSAVPFESVFTSADGLLCQDSFHQVRDMFRKAAVKKHEGDDVPDDHLSYLLEFSSSLTSRAIQSFENGDSAAAAADLRRTETCLRQHMLPWFPDFSERAMQLVQTRFYRGVLRMTAGWFAFDSETIDGLVEAIR